MSRFPWLFVFACMIAVIGGCDALSDLTGGHFIDERTRITVINNVDMTIDEVISVEAIASGEDRQDVEVSYGQRHVLDYPAYNELRSQVCVVVSASFLLVEDGHSRIISRSTSRRFSLYHRGGRSFSWVVEDDDLLAQDEC